jgi:NADPH2:quinone reductase
VLSVRVGHDRRLVVSDVAATEPEPDEAVVAVVASSVNRGELALIDSRAEGWSPGQDVAGILVKEAADGSGPAVGDRVVGLAERGAWSEQVTVPASRLAVVPEGVELETAAALPMAGSTALRTLRLLGSVIGRRVLITGASGGVGRLQAQLADLGGAEVVTVSRSGPVAGSTRNVTNVQDSDPVHAALESIGGEVLKGALSKLLPGGPLVWLGSASGERTPLSIYDFVGHENATIHTYFSYAADRTYDPGDLAALLDLVAAERLNPGISSRWPMARASEATQLLRERGANGKVLLVNDPNREPLASHSDVRPSCFEV